MGSWQLGLSSECKQTLLSYLSQLPRTTFFGPKTNVTREKRVVPFWIPASLKASQRFASPVHADLRYRRPGLRIGHQGESHIESQSRRAGQTIGNDSAVHEQSGPLRIPVTPELVGAYEVKSWRLLRAERVLDAKVGWAGVPHPPSRGTMRALCQNLTLSGSASTPPTP